MTAAENTARSLAAQLDGQSDGECPRPLFFAGASFLLMAGPHNVGGLCWCQPRIDRVICTNLNCSDAEHFVFVHDDHIH